jgi:hypothetical protein
MPAATALDPQPHNRLELVMTTVTAPPAELSDLADLEALAETAATVYRMAAERRAEAHADLTDAQSRLEQADHEWERANGGLDAAQSALRAARQAAGVIVTASGSQTGGFTVDDDGNAVFIFSQPDDCDAIGRQAVQR